MFKEKKEYRSITKDELTEYTKEVSALIDQLTTLVSKKYPTDRDTVKDVIKELCRERIKAYIRVQTNHDKFTKTMHKSSFIDDWSKL